MSKIALKPNESGTGVFTLAAPDSNADRTLTLPDEAGSVLTDVSDIEPQLKTATNASGDAPIYACRAWVNFQGQDTVFIRGSGNVSSITDNGTGDYTVNFATAMSDANYGFSAGPSASLFMYENTDGGVLNRTTSSIRISQRSASNTLFDALVCCVAIFR